MSVNPAPGTFAAVAMLAVAATVLAVPLGASAHFLDRSGTVGSVLHVAPDDDPIIGQPADIHFELKDTAGRFTASGCDCAVQISREGTVLTLLSARPATDAGGKTYGDGVDVRYTFPEAGVYELKLTGTPQTAGTFADFTITHDLRVTRTGGASVGAGQTWLWLGLAAALGIAGVVIAAVMARRRAARA